MKVISALSACVLINGGTISAQSIQSPPEIRTTATVTHSIKPDMAVFTLQFSATDSTPLAAGSAVARRANQLRTALQAAGIPRDSMATAGRYWWPQRIREVTLTLECSSEELRNDQNLCPKQVKAFAATEIIEVRLGDLRKVGAAIDTALAHRVVEISNMSFRAFDTYPAYEAALKEATQRARRQGVAIAEAAGVRLGRILSLSTEAPYSAERYYLGVIGETRAPGGTDIVAPTIPISVTVYGRWEVIQ